MSSIRLLRVTAILLAFAPGVATAADEPTGWKLSEPFYLTAVQRSDFVNKFAGVEKPEKKATTFIFKVTPARKKGGGWLLTHRLEGLASEPKHPSIEAFASMVGGEFAVSLAADLRTHDVVDVDGLLAKLDPDGPVPEPVRKSLEPTLKHLMRVVLRDAYFPVPTTEAIRGPATLEIPGTYTATGKKVYAVPKAERNGRVSLTMACELSFVVADPPADAKRAHMIALKERTPTEYTGRADFDLNAGRPVEVVSTLKTDFALTLKIGEQQIDGSGSGTTTLTYSYSDRAPAIKK